MNQDAAITEHATEVGHARHARRAALIRNASGGGLVWVLMLQAAISCLQSLKLRNPAVSVDLLFAEKGSKKFIWVNTQRSIIHHAA